MWCGSINKSIEDMENNILTEKDKSSFVSGIFIYCMIDFLEFKKGNAYWLEYLGNDIYCGRSDNILGKEFEISSDELLNNFSRFNA